MTPARLWLVWGSLLGVFAAVLWLAWSLHELDGRLRRAMQFEQGDAVQLDVVPDRSTLLSPYVPEQWVDQHLALDLPTLLLLEDQADFLGDQRSLSLNLPVGVSSATQLDRRPRGAASEDRCVLLQEPGQGVALTSEVVFASGARCRLRALPEEWGVVAHVPAQPTIVIPIDLAEEVLPKYWRSRVRQVVISFPDRELGLVRHVERSADALGLAFSRVELPGREAELQQIAKLQRMTRIVQVLGGVICLAALALLIHGQMNLLRREAGLLAALGADAAWLRRWIVRDLATQFVVAAGPPVIVCLLALAVLGMQPSAVQSAVQQGLVLALLLALGGTALAVIMARTHMQVEPATLLKEA